MTRTQLSAVAFAFATVFAGQALAADNGPATRAQVQAELAKAIRTGNMMIGESGELMREAFPNNYPAQAKSSKSRAQVKTELAEAVRNGQIVVTEDGQTLAQMYPHNYPNQTNVASKTREQVRMELAEAIANGLLDQPIEA